MIMMLFNKNKFTRFRHELEEGDRRTKGVVALGEQIFSYSERTVVVAAEKKCLEEKEIGQQENQLLRIRSQCK